tara:strand:+ start:176 stop:1117 length:942 start_codon:yes stop_codon:yes gene_type:complete
LNVLLTGGSGFLGKRIKFFLEKDGHKCISLRSSELNLEKDISSQVLEKINSINNNIEVIIHSAVFYGGIGTNLKYPFDLILRNNMMSNNIYLLAQKLKVRKFISVGSACAWPGNKSGDLKEDEVFDGRPHDSIEAYGFNKRVHLVFNKALQKQYGIESNQLALANLYGEGDVFDEERSHVISSLIKKVVDYKLFKKPLIAWGTGKAIRQFLYVDDAANIISKSVNFPHILNPINIYGEEISVKDLLKLICDIIDVDYKSVSWDSNMPDGVPRKVLAKGKLDQLIDYQFVSFKEGLKKTIDWYIANKKEADKRQ